MASVHALGKYRIIAELGQGGMAEVFLAITDGRVARGFQKLVVLKKLRHELAADPELVTMFMDEARIAARMNHPNVVQTIEVGVVDDELFLVMEYLDGQPLSGILSRARKALSLPQSLTILQDVLEGIDYAHDLTDFDGSSLHVVHRDVTPHNVFVTYGGHVKVVDFGIAKAVGRAAKTQHGMVKGKIAYMSPEQARGEDVDRRTDVFAVGVMLFEACIRGRMWEGRNETEIMRALAHGKYSTSPRQVDPSVDRELDRICAKAMAYARGDRYSTALEMQADLAAFMDVHFDRTTPRQLGAWLTQTFQTERSKTREVVESQLDDLVGETVKIPATESTPDAFHLPRAPTTTPRVSRPSLTPQGTPGGFVKNPRAPTASRAVGYGLLAGGAVAVLVTLLTAIARRPAEPASSNTPTNAITLTLRALPHEAVFQIDDGPPLENPYIGKVVADGKEHVIKARAPGHEPKMQRVPFVDDSSLRFTLARGDAQ